MLVGWEFNPAIYIWIACKELNLCALQIEGGEINTLFLNLRRLNIINQDDAVFYSVPKRPLKFIALVPLLRFTFCCTVT
jgi:hypothetical protein